MRHPLTLRRASVGLAFTVEVLPGIPGFTWGVVLNVLRNLLSAQPVRWVARARQRQADACPTAGTASVVKPAAIHGYASRHRGQAKPESPLDLPEAWAGILDREHRRTPLTADFNDHRA
jgi:hypothetical protein